MSDSALAIADETKPAKKQKRGTAEIAAFRKKYSTALEAARVQAEHTATEGWQNLYRAHRSNLKQRRDQMREDLTACGDRIGRGDASEDTAKAIGDMKKEFTEVCATEQIFYRRAIEPIMETMEACHKVIEQARSEARELVRNQPLMYDASFLEAVEKAIAEVEKVTWDKESGCIVIAMEEPGEPEKSKPSA